MRGGHPHAVACAGRAGRSRGSLDTDDLEPQRPACRAHSRARGAEIRSLGRCAVLARHGLGRPVRTDHRHGPGQRPHLRDRCHDAAPDAVRERLLPFARAVNDAMDRCGYPLCKGGVMASNPRWCASLHEWKTAFANWIDRGDPDSLLRRASSSTFARCGGCRSSPMRCARGHRPRARQFAVPETDVRQCAAKPTSAHLGFGELQAAEDDSGVRGIDLKMSGSVPFVDAARIFALAAGFRPPIPSNGSMQAGAARGIPGSEIRHRAMRSNTFSSCGCASSIGVASRAVVSPMPTSCHSTCCRISTAGFSRRRYGRFAGCSSVSSSTIPDEFRRSLVAALARRPQQHGPRRRSARSLGRRRHGNLRSRPRTPPASRDRRGRRRRRRHRIGRQLRDRAARAMPPAMPRISPCTESDTARRRRARRRPKRSRHSGTGAARLPVWDFMPISIGRFCARRSPVSGCLPTMRRGSILLRLPEPWPPTRIAPAAEASTTGSRHSASNAPPATTQPLTRSPPPSCCYGCVPSPRSRAESASTRCFGPHASRNGWESRRLFRDRAPFTPVQRIVAQCGRGVRY